MWNCCGSGGRLEIHQSDTLITFNKEEAFIQKLVPVYTKNLGFPNAVCIHLSKGFIKAKNRKLQFVLLHAEGLLVQNKLVYRNSSKKINP